MPRGYPDWFGQPQFPKYGGGRRVSGQKTITTVDETTVVEISGKGRIYGGIMEAGPVGVSPYDSTKIYIDGSLLIWTSWLDALQFKMFPESGTPLYLLCYDTVYPWYEWGIREGITFDNAFKITYKSDSANQRVINYKVFYSLIT
jgi:hypothetical protein